MHCKGAESHIVLHLQKFKLMESPILYPASLARWWFSRWKLHRGWRVLQTRSACAMFLSQTCKAHTQTFVYDTLIRDILMFTELSASFACSSVTSSWKWEEFTHVRPLILVDSSPMKFTIVSRVEVKIHVSRARHKHLNHETCCFLNE